MLSTNFSLPSPVRTNNGHSTHVNTQSLNNFYTPHLRSSLTTDTLSLTFGSSAGQEIKTEPVEPQIKQEESPSLDDLKNSVRDFARRFALDRNAGKRDEAKALQAQLRKHMDENHLEDMSFKPEIAQEAMDAASDAARAAGKPRSANPAADRMRTIFSRWPY